MDQSESNKKEQKNNSNSHIELPPRKFTTEFLVGLFAIVGVAAAGYQAVGLGGLDLFDSDDYTIYAEFDNIAGLKFGAPVEIAGVQIGAVEGIQLKDPEAMVELRLRRGIQIRDDDIAAIRTKGIIGDRYIKISRGGSDIFIDEEGVITETESVVDIEDIIGKIVHSLTDGDEEE